MTATIPIVDGDVDQAAADAGVDRFEFVSELRTRGSSVQIIMITATRSQCRATRGGARHETRVAKASEERGIAPRRQTRGGRCAARRSPLCNTWTSCAVRALGGTRGGSGFNRRNAANWVRIQPALTSSARHPIRLSDLRTTITAALAVRELRSLSFACFAFDGTQAVFVAYFVTYMTSQGHPLVAAGSLYSTVIAVALPGRILWAWVGGFYVAPHLVLGGLAFGMAVSIGLIGAFTPYWPLLAIGAVTMVVSATALSWHGIMLSEAARLAPPGRVGAVTGGVLSFGQIGALSSPAVFSLLLGLSGGYSAGWVVCAVPAVLVGVNMFRQGKLCSSVMRCDLRTV
jgi:hypothetical protein